VIIARNLLAKRFNPVFDLFFRDYDLINKTIGEFRGLFHDVSFSGVRFLISPEISLILPMNMEFLSGKRSLIIFLGPGIAGVSPFVSPNNRVNEKGFNRSAEFIPE
jgi:hypothetical protein